MVVKRNKAKPPEARKDLALAKAHLDDLLEQGRRLRQQIESVSADVHFPLTRDSDGDPSLRANAAHPDPIPTRPRKRAARGR